MGSPVFHSVHEVAPISNRTPLSPLDVALRDETVDRIWIMTVHQIGERVRHRLRSALCAAHAHDSLSSMVTL